MTFPHGEEEYARIQALLGKARAGYLPYEGEVELRALLARHDELATTLPWPKLLEFALVVVGWHIVLNERQVPA